MYVVPVSADSELVLLPVDAADEVTALVQRNQDRLARWKDWVAEPLSVERSREWLQERIDDFASGRRIGTYLRVDEELVGSVDMVIRGHIGEVGYWLDAAYEGRGLASAAVRALLDIGFGQRALERVELRTSPLNLRSRALATRLGFRYEGTLRHAVARPACDGSQAFEDAILYALLADEWLSEQAGQ
jgi:ribosomal-protein-serine acetyltransferase